jgi:hypothetical protein
MDCGHLTGDAASYLITLWGFVLRIKMAAWSGMQYQVEINRYKPRSETQFSLPNAIFTF